MPRACLLLLSGLLPALGAGPAGAADVFEVRTLHVTGRPTEVFAVASAHGPPRAAVLSLEGTVPDEHRYLTTFDPWSAADASGTRIELGPDVVGVDVGDVDPAPGAEIALLSSHALRFHRPGRPRPLLERRLDPPLPIPPRRRGIARIPFLGPWTGDGTTSALLPTLAGLRHVEIHGGSLPLPAELEAEYLTLDPAIGLRSGIEATLEWPSLALGDDDGDGRPDLFALSRYRLSVFRNGPDGLPARPTRSVAFQLFTPREERRRPATSLSGFVRDLDGDGLADVVLHRTVGTLLESDATALVFRNRGQGADPSAPPDATIQGSGGFGSLFVDDLDGDGRAEALQVLVPFGVLQVVRVLVTTKVQAVFRLFTFPPGQEQPRLSWEDGLSLPLDFDAGRVGGILPNVAGDWNGDGIRDLLYGESTGRLAIRLGERSPDGPGFGGDRVTQDVPGADRALVADLDADGLDDLVAFDTEDESGAVHVLRNRGSLRGTPPSLRAPAAGR